MPLSNTSLTFFSPIAQHWILSCEYILIMKCPFKRHSFFCLFQLVCTVCVPARTENVSSKRVFFGAIFTFLTKLEEFCSHVLILCVFTGWVRTTALWEQWNISFRSYLHVQTSRTFMWSTYELTHQPSQINNVALWKYYIFNLLI